MSNEFQPYQSWLSLPPEISKPNFYQLLSIDPDEKDKEKISAAAARATTKVRGQKPGDQARLWMGLLDELKQAKECLLDDQKRKVYDQQLAAAGKNNPTADRPQPVQKSAVQPSPFAALYPPGMGANPSATPAAKPAETQAAVAKTPPTISPAPANTSPASPPPAVTSGSVVNPVSVTPAPVSPPPVNPAPSSAIPGNLAPRAAMPQTPPAMPQTPPAMPVPTVPAASPANGSDSQSTSAAPPNVPPTAAPTADAASPMAPVFDPTLNWNDASQVPDDTNVGGAMSVAPTPVVTPASQAAANTEMPAEQAVEMARQRYEAIRRHSRNNMIKAAAFCFILVVVAGGAIYLFKDKIFGGDETKVAQSDSQNVVVDDNSADTQDTSDDQKSDGDDGDQPVGTTDDQSKPAAEDSDDEKMDDPDGEMKTDNDGTDTKPDPETDPTKPDPTKPDPVKPDPEGTTPETKPDDPATPAADPQAEKAAMRAQYAKLGTTLTTAKQALFDRKLDEANKLIADAEELGTTLEHKDKVARLKSVAEQIAIFWQTVSEECAKLQAMDEIQMSTTILAVVEANSELLVYRYNGENKRQAVIELPAGLAMKIAERAWQEETVESRITRGAVYAIDAVGNPSNAERAREIWEEAELGGGMVRPYLTFLLDDYDLVAELIEQTAVPKQDELDAAADEFKETYRKDMARTTPAARVELAQKLIADAPGAETALRYVLFEQAADQAARAGDIPLAMQAIDEQSKWFKVDLIKTKGENLENAVKYRLTPDAAKELARTAFELADEESTAKNLESAAKFAQIALAAAVKSKDVELRARAVELGQEIQDLIKKSKAP